MVGPIIRALSVVASGGTYDDVILDTYPSTVVIKWRRVVARDFTTSCTRVEIFLLRGSEYYLLKSSAQGTAAISNQTTQVFSTPGDYRVGARFYGASAGDVLELVAYGEIVED